MTPKFVSILLIILLTGAFQVKGQVADSGQEVSGLVEQYKEEASSLVYFMEYALNVLGDPTAATAEKEVIIHESYLKVFRDEKVQIEDDLVAKRGVVTYKDIQAYLKDVNFFFKEVQFEFTIDEVTHHFSEDNQLYFLVSLTRHLKGLSVDGDSLYNTRQRFVELNLDEQERLLKIVSIYTTKLSEQEALKNWWNNMAPEWQTLFAPNIQVSEHLNMQEVMAQRPDIKLSDTLFIPKNDTLSDTLLLDNPLIYNSLKHILAQEELDLSGRVLLRNLKPLSKFVRLKRLNISKTLVGDLIPLRNLTQLEVLNCSESPVVDLSPLRYAINMRELYCQRTQIADLKPLANFPKLEVLDGRYTRIHSLKPLAGLKYLTDLRCSHSPVDDLDGLSSLQALKTLHLSHTKIKQLDPLRMLNGLEQLQIDHTEVSNLGPIASAKELRVLYADNTRILGLEPLGGLENLTKVYCDNTPIPKAAATRFMVNHPRILVVFQSTALTKWWKDLPGEWKTVLRRYAPLDETPNKEQLQLLVNVDTINLDGNRQVTSLEPLREFRSLLQLRCRWTGISSLGPLRELLNLELLDCSHTRINSLAPISQLTNLKELYLQETAISSIEAIEPLTKLEVLDLSHTAVGKFEYLEKMSRLRLLYADETLMDEVNALHLMTKLPEVLVVFKTKGLQAWWGDLLPPWKGVLQAHTSVSSPALPEELHRLAYLKKVSFSDNPAVLDLSPLLGLLQLKELSFSNTKIISLDPLSRMTDLEVLRCSQSPITDLMPVSNLRRLRELDCSNTPLEDLGPIEALIQLESLNVSGTQIRDLKDLRSLVHLSNLNCSNTDVKTLKHINGLKNLLTILCYNTRIPASHILDYQTTHANAKVVHY